MSAILRHYENARAIERSKIANERAAEREFVKAHEGHRGFVTIAETTHHCPEHRVTFTRSGW